MKGLGTPIDLGQAAAIYNAASAAGNLLAAYNLAVLHLRGLAGESKGPSSCRAAVLQLKRVAERAWPALPEAQDDFNSGDYEWALLNYMKAGEWGSELGQSNAAWMLTEGYGYEGPRSGTAAVALFRRAAEQGNAAALVRLGDSYWYGKGVPRDWTRAGRAYTAAAKHRLPQALFNLGFMHQHGAGVAKDFHLAKRYYDRAAGSGDDAWLAATLGLMGLQVQKWWENVEQMLPVKWQIIGRRVFVGLQSAGTLNYSGGGGGGQNFTTAGSSSASSSSSSDAHNSHLMAGPGRVDRGPLGRIRRLFSVSTILSVLDAIDSSFDSQMALWIMGLLAIILWRRQTLRARALQRQQQHQWNAAAGNANGGAEQPVAAAVAENREDGAAAAAAAAEARQARHVVAEEPAAPADDEVVPRDE
jgi:TPR repeat protein